jgi:hypothetical protein
MFVLFSHAKARQNPKSKGGKKRRLYFLSLESEQAKRKLLKVSLSNTFNNFLGLDLSAKCCNRGSSQQRNSNDSRFK